MRASGISGKEALKIGAQRAGGAVADKLPAVGVAVGAGLVADSVLGGGEAPEKTDYLSNPDGAHFEVLETGVRLKLPKARADELGFGNGQFGTFTDHEGREFYDVTLEGIKPEERSAVLREFHQMFGLRTAPASWGPGGQGRP